MEYSTVILGINYCARWKGPPATCYARDPAAGQRRGAVRTENTEPRHHHKKFRRIKHVPSKHIPTLAGEDPQCLGHRSLRRPMARHHYLRRRQKARSYPGHNPLSQHTKTV